MPPTPATMLCCCCCRERKNGVIDERRVLRVKLLADVSWDELDPFHNWQICRRRRVVVGERRFASRLEAAEVPHLVIMRRIRRRCPSHLVIIKRRCPSASQWRNIALTSRRWRSRRRIERR